jgi:hypothetical protein
MKDVAGRARLIWGISTIEILTCTALVGSLCALYAAEALRFIPKYTQAELQMLSTANRLHWMETWANDGLLDAADTAPVKFRIDGKYVAAVPEERSDGAIDFEFKPPSHASGVITVRPAISGTGSGAVIWLCGFAPAPQGFVARGRNATDLRNEELMSTCRSRS